MRTFFPRPGDKVELRWPKPRWVAVKDRQPTTADLPFIRLTREGLVRGTNGFAFGAEGADYDFWLPVEKPVERPVAAPACYVKLLDDLQEPMSCGSLPPQWRELSSYEFVQAGDEYDYAARADWTPVGDEGCIRIGRPLKWSAEEWARNTCSSFSGRVRRRVA